MKTIEELYANHAEMPYLAPEYLEELTLKPIAKRQMERTSEGFLPGHIILLWRVQFASYRTDSPHHKYFYTTYGIDAQKELDWLVAQGYVVLEMAEQAIRHLSASQLKALLKSREVKGLSKLKRQELDQLVLELLSSVELAELTQVRAYLLTEKGQAILDSHPEIVAKHPQKKY